MNKKELLLNIGGISKTSKMPSNSWNLSAWHCNVGSKLAKIENSVCNGCYAMKGFYNMYKKGHIQRHNNKIDLYNKDSKRFEDSFITYLNKYEKNYFRWFDSGDIPNYEFLLSLVRICKNTPNIKHWIPTKEYSLIHRYLKKHKKFPKNMIVRVSAPMMDSNIKGFKYTSSVQKDKKLTGHLCNAPKQDNQCLDCRACWDPEIKNIVYKVH